MTRKKAIEQWAKAAYLPTLGPIAKGTSAATFAHAPKSAKAFAIYLEKELRRTGLNKTPIERLVPAGIDPKCVVLDLI